MRASDVHDRPVQPVATTRLGIVDVGTRDPRSAPCAESSRTLATVAATRCLGSVASRLMNVFRAATWNLDGYGSDATARLPKQLEVLKALQADVLVLTEIRDTTQLTGMTFWWSDPGAPPYGPRDHAVGIASHWRGRPLKVTDTRLSVCVALDAPAPLTCVIVYGTVIPYHLDGVRQKTAAAWQRHREAVNDVVADMDRLRSDPAHRDAGIVLAGDFNTNLDGSGWYGEPEARSLLVDGLTRAGLQCHTLEDIRKTRGSHRAIVDHLWTSTNLRPADSLHIWCDRNEPGKLSDHNGVALRLAAVE